MRAPSAAILFLTSPLARPAWAVGGERRHRQRRHPVGIGGDERPLARIPGVEQLLVRQAADQSRMDEAGKIDAGHMPGMREHARNVPDRFLRLREMIGQEPAAVLLREEAVEAPEALRQRADIEQIDDQQIAGLGAFHPDRAGQEVHDREIDIAHVVRGFVVLDEAAGPVVGLDHEFVPRLDPGNDGNVGMPSIVDHVVLVRQTPTNRLR